MTAGDVAGQVTKGYFDLGVVGAVLLIIVIFVVLQMVFMNKLLKKVGSDPNVDKLCTEIRSLITVINTQQTVTYKDMKSINDKLDRQLNTSLDIQRRVVRIDDRTYACRGNPPEKEEQHPVHEELITKGEE